MFAIRDKKYFMRLSPSMNTALGAWLCSLNDLTTKRKKKEKKKNVILKYGSISDVSVVALA